MLPGTEISQLLCPCKCLYLQYQIFVFVYLGLHPHGLIHVSDWLRLPLSLAHNNIVQQ